MAYNRLGKAAVRFAIAYLRHRYRSQIRIGAGVAAGVVGVALYLASRDVKEG